MVSQIRPFVLPDDEVPKKTQHVYRNKFTQPQDTAQREDLRAMMMQQMLPYLLFKFKLRAAAWETHGASSCVAAVLLWSYKVANLKAAFAQSAAQIVDGFLRD